MIEKRKVIEVPHGNGDKLIRVLLYGRECPKVGVMATYVKLEMLKLLGSDPQLTSCNGFEFESLQMRYEVDRWVIEVRAVEEKLEET